MYIKLLLYFCAAWFWEEYTYYMCLAWWFGPQHYGAISHTAVHALWTCSQSKRSFFHLFYAFLVMVLVLLVVTVHLYPLQVVLDRLKGMALILYNNTDFAQAAVRETKGWKIGGNKIKVKIKYSLFKKKIVCVFVLNWYFWSLIGGFCKSGKPECILPLNASLRSRHSRLLWSSTRTTVCLIYLFLSHFIVY